MSNAIGFVVSLTPADGSAPFEDKRLVLLRGSSGFSGVCLGRGDYAHNPAACANNGFFNSPAMDEKDALLYSIYDEVCARRP